MRYVSCASIIPGAIQRFGMGCRHIFKLTSTTDMVNTMRSFFTTSLLRSGTATRGLIVFAGSAILATTIGCGMTGSNSATSKIADPISPAGGGTMQGRVHGGNQPVTGSTIQIYSAGTTGYGTGASSLIPTGSYYPGGLPCVTTSGNPNGCVTKVVTDSTGSFTVTGDYTCVPGTQGYIVASGGNPGLGGTVNNANLAMMAVLGTCPAGGSYVTTVPVVDINEVTTVAAVWALQQFMAAPTGTASAPSIGAPSTTYSNGLSSPTSFATAQIGMKNAFTTAAVLADVSLGVSPNTHYPYATPEFAKMNSAANVLAYCINSDPTATTNCSTLLVNGTTGVVPAGSPNATDTIQAAWYMAQFPINNVTTAFGLGSPTPAFTGLTTAPKDWTIAVNYAPTFSPAGTAIPALDATYGLAIDAYGNVWTDSSGGTTTTGATEIGVDGSLIMAPVTTYTASSTAGSAPLFTTTVPPTARTFSAPKHIAIDLANNAWVTNGDTAAGTIGATATSTSSVAVFNGSTAAGTGGTGGGSVKGGFFVGLTPYDIAIDPSNNVLVYNGGTLSSADLAGASLSRMANDGTGFVYSTSASTTSPNRTPGAQSRLALDANTTVTGGTDGVAWIISSQGCAITGAYGSGSTKWSPISQFNANTVAALPNSNVVSAYSNATVGAGSSTNCGSTSTYVGQLISGGLANSNGIAVDRFNNIWTTSQITSSTGFDGATYLLAPSSTTGIVGSGASSSFTVIDAASTPPTAGTAPTVSGTTLRKSYSVAVDGNNNAWVMSNTLGSVAELSVNPSTGAFTFYTPGQNGTSSPTTNAGFNHNISNSANGNLAIDPSGNVWVTNNGSGAYTNAAGVAATPDLTSLTMIVGAAGPVITPQALALAVKKIGQKP